MLENYLTLVNSSNFVVLGLLKSMTLRTLFLSPFFTAGANVTVNKLRSNYSVETTVRYRLNSSAGTSVTRVNDFDLSNRFRNKQAVRLHLRGLLFVNFSAKSTFKNCYFSSRGFSHGSNRRNYCKTF